VTTLTHGDTVVLATYSNENGRGLPYRPGRSHVSHVARLEAAGLIQRNPGLVGGFTITDKGKALLALNRTAALLKSTGGKHG
jgi:hypothetical protein